MRVRSCGRKEGPSSQSSSPRGWALQPCPRERDQGSPRPGRRRGAEEPGLGGCPWPGPAARADPLAFAPGGQPVLPAAQTHVHGTALRLWGGTDHTPPLLKASQVAKSPPEKQARPPQRNKQDPPGPYRVPAPGRLHVLVPLPHLYPRLLRGLAQKSPNERTVTGTPTQPCSPLPCSTHHSQGPACGWELPPSSSLPNRAWRASGGPQLRAGG